MRCLITLLFSVFALIGQAANTPAADEAPTLAAQVREKAELAVAQFQGRAGGKLDYSEKSLDVVEEMLSEAARYRAEMPESDQRALVSLMSSYVLEVAHRQYGGEYIWMDDRDQPLLVVGEPRFHVALFAADKVKGRLSGDEGDNIPFFYQGFSARARAATPGTKALYL